jgi:diphosphomevalonate decarboxylase
MNKQAFVSSVLGEFSQTPATEIASAFAPTNIALCKYWGKRDVELNLPVTPSLSLTLPEKGTTTALTVIDKAQDEIVLNGETLANDTPFSRRIVDFLDLFRKASLHFHIDTRNNMPSSAGLASSASGFAALVDALNSLFGWHLEDRQLSLLARLGSGSACRSFWQGFVEWHRGEQADGLDSYAEPISTIWPELRLGVLILDDRVKPIGSRKAMLRCQKTSCYYPAWPDKVDRDLKTLKQAIQSKDFESLAETSENNALAMHALMFTAMPPISYWTPATQEVMQKVWWLRQEGLPVYFTQDAGPNIKLLFEEKHTAALKEHFPQLDVVVPFLQREVDR